jgi:glycosyltransferase involved in cell wall biosynthesis
MHRVLFLSYYFPPLGGAGVQRSAKFARYLPELGYQPVVVTGPGFGAGRWAPDDATLTAEVPPEVELHRIATPPPPAPAGWRARAVRWLRTPTPFSRWWIENAVATGAAVGDVDVIYASMSPFETTAAAAALSRRLERPWVADLRDPWALDEMQLHPTRIHHRLEMTRMRRALESAAVVVMNTADAAEAVRRAFGWSRHRRVEWIPNGYDAGDFSAPAPARDDSALRIVHTGYFHTELGLRHAETAQIRRVLGGGHPNVDFSGRTHVHLLQALERLMSVRPEARETVELHLAGALSPTDLAVVDRFPHRDRIVVHGYLPHAGSVELVRSADLLFFPMHHLPPGERSLIVPGKAYEYLASGRPILAAVPDGDARELMQGCENVTLCRPLDADGMLRALDDALTRHAAGRVASAQRGEILASYERRQLTRRLAAALDTARTAAEIG